MGGQASLSLDIFAIWLAKYLIGQMILLPRIGERRTVGWPTDVVIQRLMFAKCQFTLYSI